jgi:hypothetical protein
MDLHQPGFKKPSGKCFYCSREGGVPFLMTGDGELHCTRCFEDFTPDEFLAWLQDCPPIAECVPCGSSETAQDDGVARIEANCGCCKRRELNEGNREGAAGFGVASRAARYRLAFFFVGGRPRFNFPAGMSQSCSLQLGQRAGLPSIRLTQEWVQRKQVQIILGGIGIWSHDRPFFPCL